MSVIRFLLSGASQGDPLVNRGLGQFRTHHKTSSEDTSKWRKLHENFPLKMFRNPARKQASRAVRHWLRKPMVSVHLSSCCPYCVCKSMIMLRSGASFVEPYAAPTVVAVTTSTPAVTKKPRRFANVAPYVTTSSQIRHFPLRTVPPNTG